MSLGARTTAAVLGLAAFASSGLAGNAETHPGFYLAYSPGAYVEYLALIDSGRAVSGYLEAIRASRAAADGQVRTQTFSTSNGKSLHFGKSSADRTADGYTLTSMTQNGEIVQIRFKRATPQAVNAAIVALSSAVSGHRLQSNPLPAQGTPPAADALPADDAARLTAARTAVETAEAQLRTAQDTADHLSSIARHARTDATAVVEKPGVSQALNKDRVDALRTADAAELNANAAKRTVDIAATAVSIARAQEAQVRSLAAEAADRARVAHGHLSTNDRVGP